MTTPKMALTLTALAFVGLLGGGIFLFFQAGTIVKGFLEKAATQTLGVPVMIDSVILDLKDKRAVVQGLTISNEPGFDKPYAMVVEQISVKLGVVSKELIVIEDIDIAGTNVNLELTKEGSNIVVLKKGIKVPPSAKQESVPSPEGDALAETPVKVIIDRLSINTVMMHPSVNIAEGLEIEKDFTVPQIVMRDIGRQENGIVAQKAIAEVFRAVMSKLNSAAANAGLSPEALLRDAAQGKLDKVKEKFKGKLDSIF